MWFHIDPSSGTPIYRQVVEQIRQGVASGVLKAGDKLPSVRDLAVELAVNPNTIAKAYQELERDGLIETPRGRGSFIAEGVQMAPAGERIRQFTEAVDRMVAEAFLLQIHPDLVQSIVRERLELAERRRSLE